MPKKQQAYKIERDRDGGKTIWVNDAERCLGRFTVNAGEIFTTDGGTAAVHSTDPVEQWTLWVQHMKLHHDIEIADKSMPQFVKKVVAERTN